jgi:hypothetical protein
MSNYQPTDLPLQRRKLAVKARYHSREHRGGPDAGHVEGEVGAQAEQEKKGELRAAIAFAEGVDGVELARKSAAAVIKSDLSAPGRKDAPCIRRNSASIWLAIYSG